MKTTIPYPIRYLANKLTLTRTLLCVAVAAYFFFQFNGTGQVFFPDTGHYYQLVLRPNTTWFDARDGAASMSHLGMPGHLVTINSPSENAFVFDTFIRTSGADWLGGLQIPGSVE